MKIPPYHRTYEREKVHSNTIDYELLKRLFSYLQPYKGYVILSVVLMVLAKSVEIAVPVFVGKLTSEILVSSSDVTPSHLFNWVLGLGAMLIIGYMLEAANVLIKNWVGQRALLSMRTEMYDAVQKMPVSFFDHQSVGRLMSRTISDVDQINQLYSESIVPIMGNFLLLSGIVIAVGFLSWQVALICLFVIPILWWQTHQFRKNQRRCFELLRAIVSGLNSFVQERLLGVSTIRVFGSQKRERAEFEEINDDHCSVNLESIHHLAVFTSGIQFVHNFVLIMIFAILVAFTVIPGVFDAGLFFTFSLYALMVFRPIADLAERYNVLQAAMAAGERIFDILDREREDYQQGEPLDAIYTIEFDDVWFAYQNDHWILRGLTFFVKKGESLAIVGTTGAGKTTILNLLLRFYDIQKGAIRINGRDIRTYQRSSLRQQFSVIPQDPTLFSGTIEQNISMHASKSTKQAMEYLNLANLDEKQKISGNGNGLSAGEQQLITFARAAAHNGSVYILDEATANIDSASERQIQKAMLRILSEKTAIVIAHRLSTIQHAHRILVISQGKVAEQGTHSQLVQLKGIYEKLYRLLED